jgi:uncharacterized protein YkwD
LAEAVFVTTAALGLSLALSSLNAPTQVPMIGPAGSSAMHDVARGTAAGNVSASDAEVRVMLAALNAERSSRGLAPLTLDPKLSAIAANFATDMTARHYFSHSSPEGETPFTRMDRAHYRYGYAGENIALDQTPASAADALWHSPMHRENILEPHYAKVGIGVQTSNDGIIFVEDFSD